MVKKLNIMAINTGLVLPKLTRDFLREFASMVPIGVREYYYLPYWIEVRGDVEDGGEVVLHEFDDLPDDFRVFVESMRGVKKMDNDG